MESTAESTPLEAVSRRPRLGLAWQIVIGLAVGIAVGYALNHFPQMRDGVVAGLLQPAGDLFIKLIRMIVVPIVFTSMVIGIAGVGDGNGTDFHASAFVSFLRGRGTKLRFRPAGQPRHGTVLERMFGRVHTEYISNLAGNTKATKNVRSVTGSHLPEKLAEWNIQQLYYGIQHWATEYYDQQRHPALDESPSDAFQRGMRESGRREQTHILFNRDFLIATCPPVDRTGTRDVNRQRGVKVGDRFYWSEAFRSSNVAGKKLPVRYDPWDASSVYVWVKDQWHQAVCRTLLGLGQMTEVEQKLLSQEFGRRTKTKEADPHARQRLREFLQVFTPKGAMAMELERQAENKSLYNSLQLASITPVPLSPRFSLTEETSSAADVPAEQRSTTTNPSTPLHEATGLDDPFDFDDF